MIFHPPSTAFIGDVKKGGILVDTRSQNTKRFAIVHDNMNGCLKAYHPTTRLSCVDLSPPRAITEWTLTRAVGYALLLHARPVSFNYSDSRLILNKHTRDVLVTSPFKSRMSTQSICQ